jgi:hypothetical protein
VLAHSSGPSTEFADVRIVDSAGRQVPRLVERRPEPLVMPLKIAAAQPAAAELLPRPGAQRSIYHVALPYPSLPEAQIAIETPARVFQRRVQIGFERPPDRSHRDPWFMALGTADWSRTENAPATLTLPLDGAAGLDGATELTLVIDEGDNSALPLSRAQLLLPSFRLRFVRPAAAARLVYGGVRLDAPRYDLALLAPVVLGAGVADVTMAAEEETAPAAVQELISPRLFWIVLGAAVIALLGVLVKLLRQAA